MKTSTLLKLAAATSMIFSATVLAQATVGTTKHNLAGVAGNDNTLEVCVYCHTPHAADATAPLWNRSLPSPASFTIYTSSTMNMTQASGPQGISLACLSCHDGATAWDALLNVPNGSNIVIGATDNNMSGLANIGFDLTNDHPVSLTYDNTKDTAFKDATTVNATLPLYGGELECATCHDVHNNSVAPFLRVTNDGSAMCTTCHTK